MRLRPAIVVGIFLVAALDAQAQQAPWEIVFPIGNGEKQIGLDDQPNADCFGPEAITFNKDGDLLVLDTQNRRILRVKSNGDTSTAIVLPPDVGRAIDLISASDGVFLADGDRRAIVAVRNDGSVAATSAIDADNPIQEGALSVSADKIRLVAPDGVVGELDASLLGPLASAGQRDASTLSLEQPNATSLVFVDGQNSFRLDSPDQILTATALYRGPVGLLALVEQTKPRGGEDVAYSRLVRWTKVGAASDDAFAPPSRASCSPNRSVAIAADGAAVFFGVRTDATAVQIRPARFQPIGREPLLPPDESTIAVAAASDVLDLLARENGVDPTRPVAAPTKKVTTEEILNRARQALDHKWTVVPGNLQNPKVRAVCYDGEHRWTLPPYLAGKSGQSVSSIPYLWGGYFADLLVFTRDQPQGRLTGSVCTCRNASHYCVQQVARPVGLDCSGFVSFAWKLDQYHTTGSLPGAARPVNWRDLKPGYILNKAGSHVMLVEKVAGSADRTITVIHASKSRGRVYQENFTESKLRSQGYKPYERLNLAFSSAASTKPAPDSGQATASAGQSQPSVNVPVEQRPLSKNEATQIWEKVWEGSDNTPRSAEQLAEDFLRQARRRLPSAPPQPR